MPRERFNRSALNTLTLITLFVAGLVGYLRSSGTSPIAWTDTLNDERAVERCLAGNGCTLVGMGTSVPGLVHAVGWLEMRTLVAWLGADLDGTHVLIQVLNALMVVLTFHLARHFGGPLAGSLAVLTLGVAYVRLPALYNTSPLPFLGSVFVLACIAVVERPGVVSVGLAALVAAVMANVHAACVITGASVVWVALLAPQRRWQLAAFGAGLFAGASFLIAPPSWLHNVVSLLQPHDASASPPRAMAVPYSELYWTLVAIGAWVASFASRAPVWAAYRRQSHGALAVIVPFLAAFFLAARFGLDADAKYLAHLKPACAIAGAVPIALFVTLRFGPTFRRLIVSAERILPFAAALIIAVPPPFALRADDDPTPTMRDLATVTHILRFERGWDMPSIFERLKAPESALVFAAVRDLGSAESGPTAVAANAGTTAVLLRIGADEVPQPVPPNWHVVRRSARAATVLVFMQSRIDWSQFQVCVRHADTPAPLCEESSLRLDAFAVSLSARNMPSSTPRVRSTLTLRLPLRPGAPGSTTAIFMPQMRKVCGGYIASASGAGLQVASDRRHATFATPQPGQASLSTLDLEWQILSPECADVAYDGFPPFIVDGDPATVRVLEGILTRADGRP